MEALPHNISWVILMGRHSNHFPLKPNGWIMGLTNMQVLPGQIPASEKYSWAG
jgi:hypothetical protein